MDLEGAKAFIIEKLRLELNPGFTYHSLDHTLDVYAAAATLARLEGIDAGETSLIEIAALFHDSGMLNTYADHEAASVGLVTCFLPSYGFSGRDIDFINGMIMATKLPQAPTTKAARVLCDADLDYLGRDDFFLHSMALQYEWKRFRILDTTLAGWLEIQIRFLSEHRYFTSTAISMRNKKKSENLNEIVSLWQQKNQQNPGSTTLS
jgi:predicted metal-dependent HD superfamily phosphohydrolase